MKSELTCTTASLCGPQAPKRLQFRLDSLPQPPQASNPPARAAGGCLSLGSSRLAGRKVGRTRSHQGRLGKLIWLHLNRLALEAGTWCSAGAPLWPPPWLGLRGRVRGSAPGQMAALLQAPPPPTNFDFTARWLWLGAPLRAADRCHPPALRQASPEPSIPGCLLGTSLGKGAEQLPAASSICCAFFLRHNKSQIN